MIVLFVILGTLLLHLCINFYLITQYSNGNAALAPKWLRKLGSVYTLVILNFTCGIALLISSAVSTHDGNSAFKTQCEEVHGGTMIRSMQGNKCVKSFIHF